MDYVIEYTEYLKDIKQQYEIMHEKFIQEEVIKSIRACRKKIERIKDCDVNKIDIFYGIFFVEKSKKSKLSQFVPRKSYEENKEFRDLRLTFDEYLKECDNFWSYCISNMLRYECKNDYNESFGNKKWLDNIGYYICGESLYHEIKDRLETA